VPMVRERPALPRNPQPMPTSGPLEWSERFTADKLPPQWMTIHPPKRTWYATGSDGLRLTPSPTSLGEHGSGSQPAYLAHRLQHHRATLTATLAPYRPAPGELAGLALFQNESHHYVAGIEHHDGGAAVALYRRAGKDEPVTGNRLAHVDLPSSGQPVSLRFQLDGPRLDVFYSVEPDQWQPLATDLDASLLSADVAGGFIGATFGPYALGP
jgi:xylan 1,4-beta-xylosidase